MVTAKQDLPPVKNPITPLANLAVVLFLIHKIDGTDKQAFTL